MAPADRVQLYENQHLAIWVPSALPGGVYSSGILGPALAREVTGRLDESISTITEPSVHLRRLFPLSAGTHHLHLSLNGAFMVDDTTYDYREAIGRLEFEFEVLPVPLPPAIIQAGKVRRAVCTAK